MSTPEPHDAWTGPSGLRIETLAPGGERPHRTAVIAVEATPAGEPAWFTPAQWRDLCAACAQLGPGYAPEEAGAATAEPA